MTQTPLHGARRTSLLLKGSALRLGTLIFNIGATFFLMPFLVHSLGDRIYGMWALVGAIVGYYHLIDFGLATAAQRFISVANSKRDTEEASRVFSTSLVLFGFLGVAAMGLSVAVALFSGAWFPDPAEADLFFWVVMIAGADIALSFPFYAVMGALISHLRYDLMSYVQLVRSALRVGLSFYVVIDGYGLIGLALVQLGCNLGAYLVQYLMMRRAAGGIRFSGDLVDRGTAKTLFNFGKYVFLGNLSSQLQFRAANLIVAPMLGLAAVTHYAIAARLVDYNRQLVGRATRIMGPVFAEYFTRGDFENLRAKFLTSSRLGAIAVVWLGGGVVVTGHDFIGAWMGPEYVHAYLPLLVLTVGVGFGLFQTSTIDLMAAIGRHKPMALCNLAEAIASILASIALAGPLGLVGIALGVALPMTVNKVAVIPVIACRHIGLSYRRYVLSLAGVVIPVSLLQVPAWFLFEAWQSPGLTELLGVAAAYYGIVAIVAFAFILPAEDREYFFQAVPALRRLSLSRSRG